MTEHHHGLQRDLEQLASGGIGRRGILTGLGAGGAAVLLGGCGPRGGPPPGGRGENSVLIETTGADGSVCVNWSQETQGPYPADGTNRSNGEISNALAQSDIMRSDIRPDLAGGGMRAVGVELELEMLLVDVNSGCAPLTGHAVYLWHCDAAGRYSLYDLPERSYLRGAQVSDAQGLVRFTTIIPGCYNGRYPHMHFEVFSSEEKATSGKFASLTSQIAVDPRTCETVYAGDTRYGGSVSAFAGSNSIESDNIFANNGGKRIEAMTLECEGSVEAGYRGRVVVGIAI